jgi:hypothetical protein
MADTILPALLQPSFVRGLISRVRTPANPISRFFGFNLGGPNNVPIIGREHTYDISDNVRGVANFRAPHVPAGTVRANPIGRNRVTLARTNEKLPMDVDKLLYIRQLGKDAGTRDIQGRLYLEEQAKQLKKRQDHVREFIAASLFRGGQYGLVQVGDDLIPTYDLTSTLTNVDFKIPASNKLIGGSFAAGLTMDSGGNLITSTWATASNDIVTQIFAISAAFQAQVGGPLKHIFCPMGVWINVIKNDLVRQFAGTSNKPYADFTMTGDTGPDGNKIGLYSAYINVLPDIEWHIWDGGLEVHTVATATAGTAPAYVRTIPADYALFTMDDPTMWLKGIEGSELNKENDYASIKEVTGMYSWMRERSDPTTVEMHTLQNFGLELNTPKAVAIARVQ